MTDDIMERIDKVLTYIGGVLALLLILAFIAFTVWFIVGMERAG